MALSVLSLRLLNPRSIISNVSGVNLIPVRSIAEIRQYTREETILSSVACRRVDFCFGSL